MKTKPIKVIAKMEKGDIVLFLPEMRANKYCIVCFDGGHNEACISYYQGLRNPKKSEAEKVKQAIVRYENFGEYAPCIRVMRDSKKLRAMRLDWV